MNDYFKVDSTYNDDCRNEFTVKELWNHHCKR